MKYLVAIFLALIFLSCEGGLEPPPLVEPGFGGTITFVRDSWPPRDSLVNLWIVASQIYPLDSVKIFAGIFSDPPTIFVYPSFGESLPLFVVSASYDFFLPPAVYRYVAVLQQTHSDINIRNFRVVGVYASPSNPAEPGQVTVRDFAFVPNINIHVDFHKLPPQPF